MTDKTQNHTVSGNGTRHRVSRAGRARQAEAGRANLQSWHAHAQEAAQSIAMEIDAFRTDIFRELGTNATVTRRALAENAVMTYASILLVNKELRKKRNAARAAWIEKASWLSGNLTRLLKTLALDSRPRPRTLSDVLSANAPRTEQIDTPNPPKSA